MNYSYLGGQGGLSVLNPLRFRPFLREMVWGGRSLADLLGKTLPASGLYGEAWEISDHTSHSSIVAGGPNSGRTLRELLLQDAESLVGHRGESGGCHRRLER